MAALFFFRSSGRRRQFGRVPPLCYHGGMTWRTRMVQRDLFRQPTDVLAQRLLGLVLVHESEAGTCAGRIVECEMYQGPHDKGAHSYGGIPTARTAVMYGPPGHAYVYLIYGMYWCFNVVSAVQSIPHAILVRALEPLDGVDTMLMRQPPSPKVPDIRKVASGPGKVCRALGIDRHAYGLSLWQPPLYLAHPPQPWPAYTIASGPRINIGYAEEAQHWPWRFWVDGHPAVSGPRRPQVALRTPPPV